MSYADTAVTRPEFAREAPRFAAEFRDMFSGAQIGHDLHHIERTAVIEGAYAPNEDDNGDFFSDSPEKLAAKRAGLAQLRELLTSAA